MRPACCRRAAGRCRRVARRALRRREFAPSAEAAWWFVVPPSRTCGRRVCSTGRATVTVSSTAAGRRGERVVCPRMATTNPTSTTASWRGDASATTKPLELRRRPSATAASPRSWPPGTPPGTTSAPSTRPFAREAPKTAKPSCRGCSRRAGATRCAPARPRRRAAAGRSGPRADARSGAPAAEAVAAALDRARDDGSRPTNNRATPRAMGVAVPRTADGPASLLGRRRGRAR